MLYQKFIVNFAYLTYSIYFTFGFMLYSMTGFGSFAVTLPATKITVDIKSLNSKQFDMNCRMPFAFRSLEPEIRTVVAGVLERGKVDLTVSVENAVGACSAHLNLEAIKAYKRRIVEVSEAADIPLPSDWYGVLLRFPDVVTTDDDINDETMAETSDAVLTATRGALDALMKHRRAEGLRLEEFFTVRIRRIEELLADVPKYETERVEHIKARLIDSLSKIPEVEYDRGRLEQEMIYYIEKLDVNEEKQRLAQHLTYFLETMDGAESVGRGKKLGFIAQEMTREINTLGSKSNNAEMQNLVVRMKDELEQIKEQVLNVM